MSNNLKITIIGGSSFIGKNIILNAPKTWSIKASYCNSINFLEFISDFDNVEPIKIDLLKGSIPNLGTANIVLYLPTFTPGQARNNNHNTDEIMFSLHAYGIEQIYKKIDQCDLFIYFSSGVYYLNNNNSAYRNSKILGEANLQSLSLKNGFDYLILRNMEVYGPYLAKHKIIRKLCEACFNGQKSFTIFGDGKNYLDTMYIDDYVKILFSLIQHNIINLILPFARSKPVTVAKMASTIAKVYRNDNFKVIFQGEPTENTNFVLDNDELIKYSQISPNISLKDGLIKWKSLNLI